MMNNLKRVINAMQLNFTMSFLILFFGFGLFHSCEYLNLERKLMFQTGEPVAVASNSAIISAMIFDPGENGLVQFGHCWSEEPNPEIEMHPRTTLGSKDSNGGYRSLLRDLTPETHYYVRSYVIEKGGSLLYGDQIEFETPPNNFGGLQMPETSEHVAVYVDNTIVLDGRDDEPEWQMTDELRCMGRLEKDVVDFSAEDFSCYFKVLFNEEGIMFWFRVRDENIITIEEVRSDDLKSWMADYVEVYLHSGRYPTATGEWSPENTFLIRFNPFLNNETLPENMYDLGHGRNGRDWRPLEDMYSFVDFVVVPVAGGYTAEAIVRWDLFTERPEHLLYFEVLAGDTDHPDRHRESIVAWNNSDPKTLPFEYAWFNINYFGRLLLYKPDF